jgi:Cys-tRNA(Pro)/Cys-tRNA(Cys) deacylase
MATKLNSMRLLDTNDVKYEVMTYNENAHDAVEVAQLIDVPVEHVYKTLVVEKVAGGKPVLIMIAANKQLNLKKFAASIGQKKVNMAAHADAERLTGLKVGGIGALALVHKNWEVYIDKSAESLDYVCVSAGQRGINLRIPTTDLMRVLKAKAVIATGSDESEAE